LRSEAHRGNRCRLFRPRTAEHAHREYKARDLLGLEFERVIGEESTLDETVGLIHRAIK